MKRVTIFEYDPANDEAYESGFAQSAEGALKMILPGVNWGPVLCREDVHEALMECDHITHQLYLSKLEDGKPVLFNASLEGIRKEYKQWMDCTSQ